MEDCVIDSIGNDFLSQSYSQGIERITGTKHHFFNFEVPKELLKVREKTWNKLFDKYSEKMSDDIEINVVTLEPEEEDEVSEKEHSYDEHRLPMRKPSYLVQYWVDTGNPPCKILQNKNDLSETGSSLSEEEIIPPQYPSNKVNTDSKQKYKNDSSCSSVDTAAYILSNANVTKKADTIAIIEGAKRTDIQSIKNDSLNDTEATSNDKTTCTGILKTDQILYINDDDNVDTLDSDVESILFSVTLKHNTSKTNDHRKTDATIPNNTVQCKSLQNLSHNETNKTDSMNTNKKDLDAQKSVHNIVSIFQQFDNTLKLLSVDNKSNGSPNEGEALEKCFSEREQVSANIIAEEETIAKDASLPRFHRKKLYTGRESPVDLILIERHSINKLPKAKLKLHPALDTDTPIQRKISTVRKKKNKHHSFSKRKPDFKKTKRHKRKNSFSATDVTDSNDEINNEEITNNSKIQNSVDDSIKITHNNLTTQHNDVPIRKYDNANVPVRTKICKQDLISVNLNPVVLLERITPFLKQNEFERYIRKKNSFSSIDIMDSNDETNNEEVINSNQIQDSIDNSFKNVHNNVAKQYNDVPIRKYDDTNVSIRTETCQQDLISVNLNPVVLLERITPFLNQIEFGKYTRKRNSSSSIDVMDSNDDKANSEEVTTSNQIQDSIDSSFKNVHNNVTKQYNDVPSRKYDDANVSLRTKICKQDLIPVNPVVLLERINNKMDFNISNKLCLIEDLHGTESKKADNKISHTFNTTVKHKNQIFYDTDATINSTSQQEDRTNQVKRNKCGKYSIFTSISSDEDSLVYLIQPSKKRFKKSAEKKDNVPADISLAKNNLSWSSGSKQTSEKSRTGSSFNVQQQNTKSTVTELLMFQTRTYYDSDSSEKS